MEMSAVFLLLILTVIKVLKISGADSRYDALRHLRLDRPVYSLDTLEKDDCGSFDQAKAWAENHAIPELARFSIFLTEDDLHRKE